VEVPLPASTRRPDVPATGPFAGFLRAFLALSDSETLTDERIRAVRRAYYANVSTIDDAIGRIVAALERRGILDDTWIFYSSDHGEMNGEHGLLSKMVFYDASVRVPLLVRPPGGTPARGVPDLVEQFDVSATLRAIPGAPEPPGSDARSLLGYFDGQPPAPRAVSVSENFGFAFVADWSARAVLDELLETRVRPFFATPARRTHPALFSSARSCAYRLRARATARNTRPAAGASRRPSQRDTAPDAGVFAADAKRATPRSARSFSVSATIGESSGMPVASAIRTIRSKFAATAAVSTTPAGPSAPASRRRAAASAASSPATRASAKSTSSAACATPLSPASSRPATTAPGSTSRPAASPLARSSIACAVVQ
jgi:hypothetical protein